MFKQPITDSSKNSKKGLLSLERDEKGNYVTVEEGKGSSEKVRHFILRVTETMFSRVIILSLAFCLTVKLTLVKSVHAIVRVSNFNSKSL